MLTHFASGFPLKNVVDYLQYKQTNSHVYFTYSERARGEFKSAVNMLFNLNYL